MSNNTTETDINMNVAPKIEPPSPSPEYDACNESLDFKFKEEGEDMKCTVYEDEKRVNKLAGVGHLLSELRGCQTPKRHRIVLGEDGRRLYRRHVCKASVKIECGDEPNTPQSVDNNYMLYGSGGRQQQMMLSSDFPQLPTHDVEELRRLVRSRMVRCKVCKNRFGEVNILERHMRDNHPIAYEKYVEEQDRINQELIEMDRERQRLEELMSGGFIPPEGEVDAENQEVEIEEIPLPGEDSKGFVPKLNEYGAIERPEKALNWMFPFVKKKSPQCPFCDKRFRNQISLTNHLEKKHPECTEFVQCLECFKCLPSQEYLNDPKAHECDMSYLCLDCKPIRNMCTEDRLWKHRNKFHRGPNSGFKCPDCHLKFLTPRKLRKHRKMAHVFSRTYQCHFCDELFISEIGLTVHERVHTGILKFECLICDVKTNRYTQMDQHMKEHHGYVCSVCQEKCVSWNELKDHILVAHSGYVTENSTNAYVDSPRVWILYKGE